MPELPEVEVVRRGLQTAVSGRVIAGADLSAPHSDRALRRNRGDAETFRAALRGRRIAGVNRRGKYLWWVLEDAEGTADTEEDTDAPVARAGAASAGALLAHLGMSGQFRVTSAQNAPHRHTRVRFYFADDGPVLDFLDQRTFGSLTWCPGGGALPAPIIHIARDPLDAAFDADTVARLIHAKRTTIKRALLDQSVVSGIGNIYADEALHAARVHFDRVTGSLALRTIRSLLDAAAAVMRRALADGGTSFDQLYVHVNGDSGYFERSLQVYGRAGEPCGRCGAPIQRARWTNRSSFFCPRCQRRR